LYTEQRYPSMVPLRRSVVVHRAEIPEYGTTSYECCCTQGRNTRVWYHFVGVLLYTEQKYPSMVPLRMSVVVHRAEIPEYGTTSWECCCTQSRKKVHVNMISDALCVSRVIFVYFGKKRYKNYCVYPSAEERVYFQTTDFKVLEYYFDRKKGIEVLYAQNIIQHPALKVYSICRGNYWGSSIWISTQRVNC